MNLEAAADDFWRETDLDTVFPRNVEQALALKFPVDVVKLSVVTIRTVTAWLKRRRFLCDNLPESSADLMGCLYAEKGHGFIFLSGADPPDEQRFTVAHDAAHFLLDYWVPRQDVIAALGPNIEDVLDGMRAATLRERAAAILARVRIGAHWHLLPRNGTDPMADARIAHVEDRADALGLELVAPHRHIFHLLKNELEDETRETATLRLGAYFELPPYVFDRIVTEFFRPRALTFLEEAMQILKR
jgi:hypothetical protein